MLILASAKLTKGARSPWRWPPLGGEWKHVVELAVGCGVLRDPDPSAGSHVANTAEVEDFR